jgi:membrane protein YdbS with pleckstrin-like domain
MDSTPADGAFRQLDPRAIPLGRLRARIRTAIFAAITLALLGPLLFLPAASGTSLLWIGGLWTAGIVGLTVLGERWPPLAWRHTAYRLDAAGLELRRGVLWRSVINVPRSRIQHTEVSQGPLERSYGLGQVSIYTAGTTYARVTLSGIAHPVALALREDLQPEGPGDVV